MFTFNTLKLKLLLITALVEAVLVVTPVLAATSFKGGNSYIVSNTNSPAWMDPVSAKVGNVLQFHFEIVNLDGETATNVRVKADLPTNVGGESITSTFHVAADNASEVSDTATVNVVNANQSGTRSLVYFPGHAVITRHPGNAQSSLESIGSGGWVAIGDLSPENNSFIEVSFKAQVTENVAPPPPPPPAGQQQTQTQTQSQTATSGSSSSSSSATGGSVTITNPLPTVVTAAAPVVAGVQVPVKELPKTGLPFLAWVAAALIPAGFGLRRFAKGEDEIKESANYLWEKRQFKAHS